ncbi:MAG: sodium-dependent transporter [Lachnospirales bacterium]
MSESGSRQKWNSKMGFILSAVGSAVGLGNIWRFPYTLYENGGGGFLIPYFVAVFTAGIPILILEYVLGSKYRGSAPLAFARNNKKFEWVGWIPTLLSLMIILYYSSIVSWAMNYMILSFTRGWGADPNAFFFGDFLQMTGSGFDFGTINFKVLIGLLIVWGGTYLLCSKSIDKGIEKVNKVLLPLLGITMVIIIIRGVTLEGSTIGLNVLFTPDFSKLLDAKVWMAAYSQVFFSLSVAMGVMITYSSYLPKDSDVVNTAFITGLANSAFEFTVAIGIFGILGYMSATSGQPVTEVVTAGMGLAFVAFPTGFNLMGGFGGVLGVVFFASLVFAGFTSFISLTEAFIMPFIDKFKIERKKAYAIVCGGGFLISSIYSTGAGLIILDIVDYFVNTYVIVTVGIIEAVVVCYVFKLDSFKEYANRVSIQKVGKMWVYSLMFIVPIFLTLNLVVSAFTLFTSGYGGYSFSELAAFGGGTLLVIAIVTGILNNMPWKNPSDTDFVEE